MDHSTLPSFPCMLDAMLASDDDTVPGTPELIAENSCATALDAAGGGERHDAIDDMGETVKDGGHLDAGLTYRQVVPFEELVYENMVDFLRTCTETTAVPSPMGLVQTALAGFLMAKYPERYQFLRGRVRDGVVSKALVDWGSSELHWMAHARMYLSGLRKMFPGSAGVRAMTGNLGGGLFDNGRRLVVFTC
eukprot:6053567-Amphidinium_carterae.1